PVDSHGHPIPLPYEGAALPKRMNKLGASGSPGTGTVLVPDSAEEQSLNVRIEHEQHEAEKKALQELQAKGGLPLKD
ncbi:MAG: cytochrome b, partial [Gordonia sp. (in: high G+C Gram-positive bacteria)]